MVKKYLLLTAAIAVGVSTLVVLMRSAARRNEVANYSLDINISN